MLKIIILACALLGILTAVSVESWLRKNIGNKELASHVYSATLEKYSEFWFSLLIPLSVLIALFGIAVATLLGKTTLIAYAVGAISTLISLFIGSRSFVSGTVSASSIIFDGDIKSGMRSSYRSGAVIGLSVSTFAVATLSILFFFVKQEQLVGLASGYALGAAVCVIGIRLSGAVLTSAHKLSSLDEHTVDYMGAYTANGADYAETLILSTCSTALLAEVGVATAGGSATFSVEAAAKYPIVLMACGIVASVIGIFVYRAFTGKYSHFGFTAGNFVSGVLMFGAAMYFSDYSLKDRAYAFCIGFGILAQLLSGEYCKAFSMEGSVFRRNLPSTKDEIVDIPMLHGLGVGMISAFVPGIITVVAMLLSFSVAQYYGIALAAVGAASLSAVNLAVRDYACILASSRSFAETADENLEDNRGYYKVLRRTASWSKASGRAYSSVCTTMTVTALLMAIIVNSEKESIDLANTIVLTGLLIGTITIFVMLGLLIRSIINSTTLMTESSADDSGEYRNIYSVRGILILEILAVAVPAILGLIAGIDCVIGFTVAVIITGMTLVFAFNNTGRYYDRITPEALTTIIQMMTVIALVCTPAFIKFGGFSF